jgi:hypothetical protein
MRDERGEVKPRKFPENGGTRFGARTISGDRDAPDITQRVPCILTLSSANSILKLEKLNIKQGVSTEGDA